MNIRDTLARKFNKKINETLNFFYTHANPGRKRLLLDHDGLERGWSKVYMQQLERFQPRTHRFFRIMVPWYVSKISSHIFPIFPCLLLESHSLLYSSSYLSSSMETAHQLHHHHHHRQRSWCPAKGAALVPCIEPTFPNSSSDKILTKESFELSFRYFSLRV